MTTNNNTKSYQTTLAQDPEVLAKPKDQILHWSRPRVAVEFPPLRMPAKMPCFGSENKTINDILTEFQDSEKPLKLKKIKDQKKVCMWNLRPTGKLSCPRFSISRPTNLEELLCRSAILGELKWIVKCQNFYWSFQPTNNCEPITFEIRHDLAFDWSLWMIRAIDMIFPREKNLDFGFTGSWTSQSSYTCSVFVQNKLLFVSLSFRLNSILESAGSQAPFADNKPRKGKILLAE